MFDVIINFRGGKPPWKNYWKGISYMFYDKAFILFWLWNLFLCVFFSLQGKISDQVYNYPEGLGEVLYREQFDFNAEPPWEPSWW